MTFYADMADTATDLLTEFGQEVTITRPSLNFDPVTNKPTSGGTVNNTTVGLFTNIDRSLVDGTRIQDTERVMVIDASFAPRMGDLVDVYGAVAAESVGAAPGIILSAGQAVAWTIVAIREINPAGTPVCYFVQVRR
jgi:hypothetical protein